MDTSDHIADHWSSADEGKQSEIADVWSSEHESSSDGITEEWSPAATDAQEPLDDIADEWTSSENIDGADGNANVNVAEEWSSANEEEVLHSSNPTVTSQMVVSQSHITIDQPETSIPLLDAWPAINFNDLLTFSPTNSTSDVPASVNDHQYGPEHFNFLQDNMFVDDPSESEED